MSLQESFEQLREFDYSDPNKLGVWPIPVKIVVCVLIVAIVLAATFYFKIRDINQTLARVTLEERTLRTSFETKSAQAANLEAYQAQMEEMQRSFESLLARLPSDTEVPGLLEDIDARSVESGSSIQSIELGAEQDAEYYVELPITINVIGSYHDFGNFVSGVAGMPRIVTLHDFEIASHQDSGDLAMKITAKTYHYQQRGSEDE
ncbi:MAG TPA: type 4a pilus biogenesis protein PilO [Cellvibrionaceae bacterium]